MKMGKSQNLKKVRAEMPFLSGGNLEAMVTHNVITPDVRKKHLKYMLQIAQAVLGMHNLQIAHCDLKLTNFLFDKEKDTAFLSDFGLASQFKSKAFAGTFPAPECAPIQPKLTHSIPIQATPENDCWAFGLALFSMLRGKNKMIYTFRAAYDRGQKTIQETGKAICTFLEKSNDPADKLIQQLLSQDPQHRPPMQKIVTQLEALI
jgi:serine/threonine protein kinase